MSKQLVLETLFYAVFLALLYSIYRTFNLSCTLGDSCTTNAYMIQPAINLLLALFVFRLLGVYKKSLQVNVRFEKQIRTVLILSIGLLLIALLPMVMITVLSWFANFY